MSFWMITLALALMVALLLALAAIRRREGAESAAAYDLRVYRDQLRDVDRDAARGIIAEAEAERLRAEVSRRILAADAALKAEIADAAKPGRSGGGLAIAFGLVCIAGSFTLYLGVAGILGLMGWSREDIIELRAATAITLAPDEDGRPRQIHPVFAGLGSPGYGDLGLELRKTIAEERRQNRPGQEIAEAQIPPRPQLNAPAPETLALMERLRETVATRPDDLQGHVLLAQYEARLGNFAASYAAQEKVIAIKGDDATASDYADLADMMILAAGGYVSPEAERALEAALARDRTNGTARYYYGLMMTQIGRPDQGFFIWRDLLQSSPPDAPWVGPVREVIEQAAELAGVDYTLPPAAGQGLRGPTAEDVQAAGQMTQEERTEMIRGMVANLSDRLATEGGTPEEWARLIGALGVLGDEAQAIAIFNEAQSTFAGNDAALEIVRGGARRAGLIP